jgi:hypothetical protein
MATADDYKRFRTRFSSSFMSDSKWVRLFSAADDAGVNIEKAYWSFIDTERVLELGLPHKRELLQTRFMDGRFQSIEYKWIRAIFVPREFRPLLNVGLTRVQDIGALRSAIEAAGKFQFCEDE